MDFFRNSQAAVNRGAAHLLGISISYWAQNIRWADGRLFAAGPIPQQLGAPS
jgi:hypothetical protein